MHISLLCLLREPDTQILVSKNYSLIEGTRALGEVIDSRTGTGKIQDRPGVNKNGNILKGHRN